METKPESAASDNTKCFSTSAIGAQAGRRATTVLPNFFTGGALSSVKLD